MSGIHILNIWAFVGLMGCKNRAVVKVPSSGRLGNGKIVAWMWVSCPIFHEQLSSRALVVPRSGPWCRLVIFLYEEVQVVNHYLVWHSHEPEEIVPRPYKKEHA